MYLYHLQGVETRDGQIVRDGSTPLQLYQTCTGSGPASGPAPACVVCKSLLEMRLPAAEMVFLPLDEVQRAATLPTTIGKVVDELRSRSEKAWRERIQ